MGMLVEGVWQDVWYDTKKTGGKFVRQESRFRDWVSDDGSTEFTAEPDRYHLYVSLACPWAHRTLIVRKLKKLENIISVSVVDPLMLDNGWEFSNNEGCIPDSINNTEYLHEVYTKADPTYTGRVTVPILWDKKLNTIVNNESAEIIRMFNSRFNEFGNADLDFSPIELRDEINAINDKVYRKINNGVYKCGFSTTQAAYEKAFDNLFDALDEIEIILSKNRYLVGSQLTEADWRLFTTLVRFDSVYVGHFKCNKKRIADYHNMQNYLRELYQMPGIAETVNLDHIKQHYYRSHVSINPNGIVPKGPELSLETLHNRSISQ